MSSESAVARCVVTNAVLTTDGVFISGDRTPKPELRKLFGRFGVSPKGDSKAGVLFLLLRGVRDGLWLLLRDGLWLLRELPLRGVAAVLGVEPGIRRDRRPGRAPRKAELVEDDVSKGFGSAARAYHTVSRNLTQTRPL